MTARPCRPGRTPRRDGRHEACDRDRAVLADVVPADGDPDSLSQATTANWSALIEPETTFAFTGVSVR